MPFTIVQGDITKQKVDAIVNAANVHLLHGGGVCGAIFDAAGPRELQEACDRLAPIETGEAVITPGFALAAGHIVHTAGPVYRGGGHGEEGQLRACYMNSLDVAFANGCGSIAFPLISSGIFGYPKDEALAVATGAITEWLFSAGTDKGGGGADKEGDDVGAGEVVDDVGAGEGYGGTDAIKQEGGAAKADMDVLLVVFDKGAFAPPAGLAARVRAFLEENFAGGRRTQEYFEAIAERHEAEEKYRIEDRQRDEDRHRDEIKRRDEAGRGLEEKRGLEGKHKDGGRHRPRDKRGPGRGHGFEEASFLLVEGREAERRPCDLGALPTPGSAAPGLTAPGLEAPGLTVPGLEAPLPLKLDEPFSATLFRLIDAKGKTDVEVYKRANLDRKLFSKIRKGDGYMPSKKTAVALAVALELTPEETNGLLESAGFALSRSIVFDVIVEYFITNRRYDVFEINNMLFEYDQPLLGG